MTIVLSDSYVNDESDVTVNKLDGGKVRLYDGTRPNTPNDAITSQNLIVEITLGSPAFGAAGATALGQADLASVVSGIVAIAGTMSWFRLLESDGTTVAIDGDVTEEGFGGDIEVERAAVLVGEVIELQTLTYKRNP